MTEKTNLSCAGLLPQGPLEGSGVGQAKSKSLELHQNFPDGWQESKSKSLSHHLLISHVRKQSTGSEVEQPGLKLRHQHVKSVPYMAA